MAIRGPRDRPEVRPEQQPGMRPTRDQPASPLQRLLDFGAARTPQEARRVLTEVLASLRAAGFPVPAAGSPESQLNAALKLFQQAKGLPANGQLDRATHDALVDGGLLPRADTSEAKDKRDAKVSEAPSRFVVDVPRGQPRASDLGLPKGGPAPDGAKSTQGVELEQLIDKNAQNKAPEIDLKSFLSSLRAAGFGSGAKGADQLKDALKKLQKAEGLPQSGQIDQKTAEALVRRGIVDERVLPLAMTSTNEPQVPTQAQRSPDSPSSTQGAKEGEARGTQAGADGDVKGRGANDGKGAGVDGKGGEGQSTTSGANASKGSDGTEGTGDVDDPWIESRDGNAPAGDEDIDDERRGHANVDDRDAFDPAGHWEVAKISEQIVAGLAAIVRDDDGKGAATYAWDFTLYRPGVYGAKQPAERLFHLVVSKASAFDELWEKARAALNAKLIDLEPEAALVDAEDFARALRVARVKDVSPSTSSSA